MGSVAPLKVNVPELPDWLPPPFTGKAVLLIVGGVGAVSSTPKWQGPAAGESYGAVLGIMVDGDASDFGLDAALVDVSVVWMTTREVDRGIGPARIARRGSGDVVRVVAGVLLVESKPA